MKVKKLPYSVQRSPGRISKCKHNSQQRVTEVRVLEGLDE